MRSKRQVYLQVEEGQLGREEPPAGAAEQSSRSRDLYVPSATASWRMNMLTHGNLPDASFKQIKSVMPFICFTTPLTNLPDC